MDVNDATGTRTHCPGAAIKMSVPGPGWGLGRHDHAAKLCNCTLKSLRVSPNAAWPAVTNEEGAGGARRAGETTVQRGARQRGQYGLGGRGDRHGTDVRDLGSTAVPGWRGGGRFGMASCRLPRFHGHTQGGTIAGLAIFEQWTFGPLRPSSPP